MLDAFMLVLTLSLIAAAVVVLWWPPYAPVALVRALPLVSEVTVGLRFWDWDREEVVEIDGYWTRKTLAVIPLASGRYAETEGEKQEALHLEAPRGYVQQRVQESPEWRNLNEFEAWLRCGERLLAEEAARIQGGAHGV